MDLRTILRETHGRWLGHGRPPAGPIPGISIDSRTLRSGEVFFALDGERFDGHDFVESAFRSGASACVVGERRATGDLRHLGGRLIAVGEPLDALEHLASWHRRALAFEVTAVTGSFGKTTTKEFLRVLLGRRFQVIAAPKSFNNRLGVALTLLAAKRGTEHVIAEFGTSGAGEISHLSRLARPERAVITAIGRAHLNGLKDIKGVIAAKAEILDGLEVDAVAYLNAELEGFEELARKVPGRLKTFGWGRGDFAISSVSSVEGRGKEAPGSGRHGYHFKVAGQELYLGVLGKHNLLNAAAAIAVARDVGVSWDEVRSGLLDCRLPPRRLQLDVAGGVLILDDAYNANPNTMISAIETWDELAGGACGRRVAVLGDMLEMGEQARPFHEEVGERLAASRVDLLVTVGLESRYLARALLRERSSTRGEPVEAVHFQKASQVLGFLKDRLRAGDQVLFKGSNRMGLSELAARLREYLEMARTGEKP